MRRKICVVVMLVATGFTAHAATYRWVDDRGNVNFTDDPDSIPRQYRQQAETRKDITTRDPGVRASVENGAKRAEAIRNEETRKTQELERQEAEDAQRIRQARLDEQKELDKEKEKERKANKRKRGYSRRYVWGKKKG